MDALFEQLQDLIAVASDVGGGKEDRVHALADGKEVLLGCLMLEQEEGAEQRAEEGKGGREWLGIRS